MLLVCPAGSLPSVKAAIENGADAVYLGLNNDTNARHFPGLNFDQEKLCEAVSYIQSHKKKAYLALNTYPQGAKVKTWHQAISLASELKMDAVIIADIGLLDYANKHYPQLALHLSVQASATNWAALEFYSQHFNIKRAVLPRVLSIKQVQQVIENSSIEIEVFGFGSLCIMAEGRCYLSSYLTGDSPNNCGACSPAEFVRWQEVGDITQSRLNGQLIDQFTANEQVGYPTLCKGRYYVDGQLIHALEEPTSLNTLELLPELKKMDVSAIKIEGRQRSPAYIKKVTKVWRTAIDAAIDGRRFNKTACDQVLNKLSEGQQTTLGAYHRAWQ
jgi:O2-independent ubiquinone biosynthesis protein UbiU